MKDDIPIDDQRWLKVARREPATDFVYAVATTGVYCRPGCASRLPKRDNVRFFDTADAAEGAGFRPCKRCRPGHGPVADTRLAVVAETCRLIETAETIPTLDDLAARVGYSAHHLQRFFQETVGVSPRQYGEALRAARLRKELRQGGGVDTALYGAGFGSSSRLYEQADRLLGMSPASYAKGGRGAAIAFTIADCLLGRLLVAVTAKGVCLVGLGDDDTKLEAEMRDDFAQATIRRDDEAVGDALAAVLAHLDGRAPHADLPLDIQATAFQRQVWRALLAIPPGETRTYGEIARAIGKPGAARAVGRACGSNPVALVIPCHRAMGSAGRITGYHWGVERKRALLARETALSAGPETPPED